MTLLNCIFAGFVAASTLFSSCLAQNPQPTNYTDPTTNITFGTWDIKGDSNAGGLTFGMALPANGLKNDSSEFIGYLNCAAKNASTAEGWCGIALGGAMTDALLFLAYPDGDTVKTSLRWTEKYAPPQAYTGNATVTKISSVVNAAGFSLVFHCEDCLHWSQNGTTGAASTSHGMLDLGYAQSIKAPGNPACADEATLAFHDLHGTWTAILDESSTSESYDEWRGNLANHTSSSGCPQAKNQTVEHGA